MHYAVYYHGLIFEFVIKIDDDENYISRQDILIEIVSSCFWPVRGELPWREVGWAKCALHCPK